MKIFVCLKEVPSRDTRYEIGPQGDWIKEADLSFEINECDEYALEEALKLQEKFGGEVALLTIGSERAEKSMRKGLAMGADRGILVEDPGRQLTSPFGIASVLAEILKKEQYDLVLAGTQSDDFGYGQTGVMLAELLGVPHATIVMEVAADPQTAQVTAAPRDGKRLVPASADADARRSHYTSRNFADPLYLAEGDYGGQTQRDPKNSAG